MKASELIGILHEHMLKRPDADVAIVHPDSGMTFEVRSVKVRDLRNQRFPEEKMVIAISDSDEWSWVS